MGVRSNLLGLVLDFLSLWGDPEELLDSDATNCRTGGIVGGHKSVVVLSQHSWVPEGHNIR
jgi:hypothetical protein